MAEFDDHAVVIRVDGERNQDGGARFLAKAVKRYSLATTRWVQATKADVSNVTS